MENMMNAHIIFPVKCLEWVANLIPIRNKNGDIHLCVYYRSLNKYSVKNNFPLPNMDQILQQVTGSQMMSLLNGFSNYIQIHLNNVDKFKTTFTTCWGTFSYERMPFVLINEGVVAPKNCCIVEGFWLVSSRMCIFLFMRFFGLDEDCCLWSSR